MKVYAYPVRKGMKFSSGFHFQGYQRDSKQLEPTINESVRVEYSPLKRAIGVALAVVIAALIVMVIKDGAPW